MLSIRAGKRGRMFERIFDSVAQSLGGESFSKSLRQGLDELSRWLPDLGEATQKPEGARPCNRHSRTADLTNWSCDDFRQQVHSCARQNTRFHELPRTIDLAGLAAQMRRLREQARDGNEYGRGCHMRLSDGKFEMGETCKGNSEHVGVSFRSGLMLVPVIMMHTHPAMPGNALTPCHFSPQDFRSFLEFKPLLASIVIAPAASLMVVKTNATPPVQKISDNYFESVYDSVGASPFIAREAVQARATQRICRELHLELYVRRGNEGDFKFHAVELK